MADAWAVFCKIALNAGGVAIAADEAHRYCERHYEKTQPFLETILTQGRHYRTPFLWTSTRPTKLPPEFRTQSDRINTWYAHDTTYLGWLKPMAGDLIPSLAKAPKYSHIRTYADKPPDLIGPNGRKIKV